MIVKLILVTFLVIHVVSLKIANVPMQLYI